MRRVHLWSLHLTVMLLRILGILGPQSSTFSSDPGTGWHLKSGEVMRGTLTPLYLDPFLALPEGAPSRVWICDQWLSDILFSLAFSSSGFEGLNLIVTALFITTFFALLYSELTKKESGTSVQQGGLHRSALHHSAVAASIACLLSFKLAQVHFILRPVVFSFLLFVPVWRASRTLANTGELPKKAAILLPFMFTLWANLHPSFFLGLMWLGLGFACAVLSGRTRIGSVPLGVLIACGACTLINPYGLDLHRSIFELTQSDYFMKLHEEWLPPDFTSSEGSFFLGTLILVCIGSTLTLFTKELRSHLNLFDLVSCGAALALALRSVRTVPVWGIVSAPLFALSVYALKTCLFRLLGNPHTFVQGWQNIERRENPSQGRIQAMLLAISLVVLSFSPSMLKLRGVDPSIAGAGFPVGLIERLKRDVESVGKKSILFAHPSFGGTITLYGYPQVQAVIDDRNSLIGEAFYRKFFAAREKRSLFEAFAKEVGVTHILLSREEEQEFQIHEWGLTSLLAEDSSHLLYSLN